MNKFILFFVIAFSLFAEKTDILFHLHDAGETYALLPVIRKLDVDYLIMTTGVAEKLVGGIPKERLRTFADLESIEPKEVVTGVASELQGQVLDYYRAKGIPTFAYWDNFNADGENPYFKTAQRVEKYADVLLLPCESLVADFAQRPTRVVGHPTLEPQVTPKIALWIGGYGKDYEEAFDLFQEGIATVENITVLIQHHPKTGLKNALPLNAALSIADLVICHQSTAAFQALAANIPVLHVIPEGQFFDSIPLQKGLAKRVCTKDAFAVAVKEALEADVSGFFELMGIPKNSTECCKATLLEKFHSGNQVLHTSPKNKFYQANADAIQFVETFLKDAVPLESDAEVLHYASDQVTVDGVFVELGTYKARTTNFIAALNPHQTIYTFDSFLGLPFEWDKGDKVFPKEFFAWPMAEKSPLLLLNVELKRGWFSDTLPAFVFVQDRPIAFLHVDCDIYESTSQALDILGPKIVDGTIILFDEFYNYPNYRNHEFKAFQEFLEKYSFKAEYLAFNPLHEQVAVRVRKE